MKLFHYVRGTRFLESGGRKIARRRQSRDARHIAAASDAI